jgi:hypothetical protein
MSVRADEPVPTLYTLYLDSRQLRVDLGELDADCSNSSAAACTAAELRVRGEQTLNFRARFLCCIGVLEDDEGLQQRERR